MSIRTDPLIAARVPQEVKDWIERKAAEDERSQNWLMRKILIDAHLASQKKEKAA
jgi:hypothetical protein